MKSLSVLCLLALTSCLSQVSVTPPDEPLRSRQTELFMKRIVDAGRDGDWLVTRGYKAGDVLVAGATTTPLSHAALLDRTRWEVIEAEAEGVHRTDLWKFVHNAHRLILIRPIWSTEKRGPRAVAKARGLVGSGYDLPGIFGINCPGRFYCSELVVHVYEEFQRESDRVPHVIEPGQLYLWGKVLLDTRPRDGAENQF